jgi:hypothetical protein
MNESVIIRTLASNKAFLSKDSTKELCSDTSWIEEQCSLALTKSSVWPSVTRVDDLKLVLAELLGLIDEDVIVLDPPKLTIYFLLILCIREHNPRSIQETKLMVSSSPAVSQLRPLPHELVYVIAFDLVPDPANDAAIRARSLLSAIKHDALQTAGLATGPRSTTTNPCCGIRPSLVDQLTKLELLGLENQLDWHELSRKPALWIAVRLAHRIAHGKPGKEADQYNPEDA